MAKGLGTLDWVKRTGGKLAWYDRMNLIFQGIRAQAASSKRKRIGARFRYIELDNITPPDSPIALEAMQFCAEVSPPFLFNHSLRAYFWARLLDDQRTAVDDEVIFTALMLHDIGLTDTYRQGNYLNYCFTLAGAQKAQELAEKHSWSEKRSDLVANAITLHMNLILSSSHGREADLVKDGTGADVAGLKLELLHQDQIDGVIQKYPRLNQNDDILKVVRRESEERPCCRMALFYRKLGMRNAVRKSPFQE